MRKTPSSRSLTEIFPPRNKGYYLIYSPGIPNANALPQTARYDPPDRAVRERASRCGKDTCGGKARVRLPDAWTLDTWIAGWAGLCFPK